MKTLLILIVTVVAIFANSSIKSIDIFKNREFINQKIDTKQKSIKLLSLVKLEDIKFLMDEGCSLKAIDIDSKNFQDDQLSIEIKKLENEISKKRNRVKALNSNISFLEKSSFSKVENISSLKEASSFIKEEVLSSYNEIKNLEDRIDKDKQELSKLIQKRDNSSYTVLNYDVSCGGEVLVNYPIKELEKRSIFDINYSSKDKKLELTNQLFIKHSLGEDLKNIDINLYTYNYIDMVKPYKFVPEYLDVSEKKVNRVYNESMVSSTLPIVKAKLAVKPSYDYFEGTTKSFFRASNVNLDAGKENRVVFANDIYSAKSSIEIDGYSMSQAFYRVDFKSNKLYGVLNANLYLDGVYVGKNSFDNIKKDALSSIYFGNSKLIEIKKELMKDIKEEPFFSINRLKTEKVWNYTITNRSKTSEKIVLLDRVPVSKHEDIKVKLIGKTKESKLGKDGKITFEFKLDTKESKSINFGYEIDKPTVK